VYNNKYTQIAELRGNGMPSTNTISISAAVMVVSAILGLWWNIEIKMEKAIQKSTDLITAQIIHDVTQLAELHIADLEVRHRILSREIASYGTSTPAPERLFILRDAISSQIIETKEKQW